MSDEHCTSPVFELHNLTFRSAMTAGLPWRRTTISSVGYLFTDNTVPVRKDDRSHVCIDVTVLVDIELGVGIAMRYLNRF